MDMDKLKSKIIPYCASMPEVIACYLYGSYAAGTSRKGSDLDLAFLLAGSTPLSAYNDFRFRAISELGRITRLDVHPLIINNAGEVILEQVFRRGVCLYGNDEEELRAFRRLKFPMIAEFAYYINMMRTKLKQRYGAQAHGPYGADGSSRRIP